MKKIFKRTSLLLATALIGVTVQAQKSPQDMDRFIDALMRRMTVEEKIGQLNLPVTGEITTGQAKSSDVDKEIEQGLVAVRSRKDGDLGTMTLADFRAKLLDEIATKAK